MEFSYEELNKRKQARQKQMEEKAKRSRGRKRILLAAAAALALCAIVVTVVVLINKTPVESPENPTVSEEITTNTEETLQEQIPTENPNTVIHFVAGGDVDVTDKVVAAGDRDGAYRYTDLFMDIVPVLAGADLATVNFEGNLAGEPYGTASKSAPQALVEALRDAGVDFLQTANSQCVANGLDGLRATLQGIRQADLTPVGTYSDSEEFKKLGGYVIRQVQGIRVAVVAFTKGMDGRGLPAGSDDCVNLLYTDYNSTYQKVDTEGITAVLKAVQNQKPDITIALLHWGSEYNNKVNKTQETIVELMQQEGVDAIIGTHSHFVQTVTFDADKGTLVAYGLGDLCGDANSVGTDYSVLLDLEITKNSETGEVKLTNFTYTPIFMQDETANGGTMRILRIPDAMLAYEQNSVQRVSDATYAAMKTALEKIQTRMAQE